MPQSLKNVAKTAVTYLQPKTKIQHERQRRVLDAIGLKRRQPALSLTEAAHRSGTTVKTIRRYAPGALEMRSGRLDVSARDEIPRTLQFLTPSGRIDVTVKNLRDASKIAKYHNAVRHAFATFGLETERLDKYTGKTIRAGGKTHEFITDFQTLSRLARAGEVHFLDIYGGSK